MKKIRMLYILNVAKRVNNFSYSSMVAAQNAGMEFHIAGNWGYESERERQKDEERYGIRIHQIDFIRRPYDIRNVKAYRQVCQLIKREKIDVIHCNTPIGGVVGRLAGKKCGVETIIYQAHGFHFYEGAPLVNWMLYYPIEKWLARFTDVLITINKEDYAFAKRKIQLRKNGVVEYVPGVGIDTSLYGMRDEGRIGLREELGLSEIRKAVCIISVGELSRNKNNEVILRAMKETGNPNIHYLICGTGEQETYLRKMAAELGIEKQIHFMGYRGDIRACYHAADIYVLPSYREGLSRSLMEAMASGLPCIAGKIRGNTDLLEDGKGGYLVSVNDIAEMADRLNLLYGDEEMRRRMGACNMSRILDFDMKTVIERMEGVYRGLRGESRGIN